MLFSSYTKLCDITNLWNRLTTTWICIFYVQSVQYVSACVCVCLLYICVYVREKAVYASVCARTCICTVLWKGGYISILVRIHILFLKGADVTDLQHTDFSPYHHEKYDFKEMFLDDWCKKWKCWRASRRNAIATALQITEWGVWCHWVCKCNRITFLVFKCLF